jgi:zinc transport system ATP-binding protein
MNTPLLHVENMAVQLNGEHIIEHLSFDVYEGEIIMILGPNGAGKTVLLKTLLTILPHSGTIEWKKGAKIRYVPQRLPYMRDIPLSVQEFFELKKVVKKDIVPMLNAVGIEGDGILKKRMGDLSSGQFQRILVSWVLLDNPTVLLFDEPFAGVDVSGKESIYDLLGKLQKEKHLTIFLVSHDLSIVYSFATKVLCLNKKMVCTGSPQEVLTPENLSMLYGGETKFYAHSHE